MTDDSIALRELLEKSADADLLREMIGFAGERLMELEVQALTGAAHGERSPERLVQRNGYRDRVWETRAGTVVQGISTRSVDELVKALGMAGISKSQVSRLCAEIDERVRTFLERPLEGDWPYLWIDATYVKVREAGRIVSVAVTIAVAVNTDGRREVLGMATGVSEAETFWVEFLRKLKRRGLAGVKLVISDAHEGIKAAVARVFRATWQRCRVGLLKKVRRRGLVVQILWVRAREDRDVGSQGAPAARAVRCRNGSRAAARRSCPGPGRSRPGARLATRGGGGALRRRRWQAEHRSGGGDPADARRLPARHRPRPAADARGPGQSRDPLVLRLRLA